eukprot:2747446-Pyramimonas_sp.AAC.1
MTPPPPNAATPTALDAREPAPTSTLALDVREPEATPADAQTLAELVKYRIMGAHDCCARSQHET